MNWIVRVVFMTCLIFAGFVLSLPVSAATVSGSAADSAADNQYTAIIPFVVSGQEYLSVDSGSEQSDWSQFTIFVEDSLNNEVVTFLPFPVGEDKTGQITLFEPSDGGLPFAATPTTYYLFIQGTTPDSFPTAGGLTSSTYNVELAITATPLPKTWVLLLGGLGLIAMLLGRGWRSREPQYG